jgi:hypothetical protein
MEGNLQMEKMIVDESGRLMMLRWCSQIRTMSRCPTSPWENLEKVRRRSMCLILEHA